jgi:hypothetical protein
MLIKILIGIVGVLILVLAAAATRPAAYRVERKLEVATSPDFVFYEINDLRRFAGILVLFGTPLDKSDPDLQKTVTGPEYGVGQSYAWKGKEAGKGKMTIEESVPAERVGIRLVFEEPMASTSLCALTIAGTPTGSVVTWTMTGEHNFLGKVLGMFMNMDKMLGADLEKGLALLKTAAEAKQVR